MAHPSVGTRSKSVSILSRPSNQIYSTFAVHDPEKAINQTAKQHSFRKFLVFNKLAFKKIAVRLQTLENKILDFKKIARQIAPRGCDARFLPSSA